MMSSMTNDVYLSVVIPCLNGGKTIARQLAALAEQEPECEWEVIVADNGSTDNSLAVVASFADRLNIRSADASEKRGINFARNRGIMESRGQYIVLCDVDDFADKLFLLGYARRFRAGAEIAGGDLVRFVGQVTPSMRPESGINGGLGFLDWPYGANCGFARSVFDELGGFNESYILGGDEADFFWRAQIKGHALTSVPEAVMFYGQRKSLRGVFRQHLAFGKSHVQLYTRFRKHGMPRQSAAGLRRIAGLVRAPLAGIRRESARRYAVNAGVALGHLIGSWRERTLYL